MKTYTSPIFKISTCLLLAALFLNVRVQGQVYPTKVGYFHQGSSVVVARSDSSRALGFVNTARNDHNLGASANTQFVSLGYRGGIVLEFATPLANVAGPDFKIWETTYGAPTCNSQSERAVVWARQNECQPWILLTPEVGECQDFEVDLGILTWARFLYIEDRTISQTGSDYFDLDGVQGYAPYEGTQVSLENLYSPDNVISASQGKRSNGMAVPAGRSNLSKALGAPQANDQSTSDENSNFYSLGFGGTVTLKFPYTIINKEGADLAVYETTFGDHPSQPSTYYPERAAFEGSVDGTIFFNLEAMASPGDADNILTRDGKLEIPMAYRGLNFIRVTDLTDRYSFHEVVDAYDLDGIVGLNQCAGQPEIIPVGCPTPGAPGCGFNLSLQANTSDQSISVITDGLNTEPHRVQMLDITGRSVYSAVFTDPSSSYSIDISGLPTGIYIVIVESSDKREAIRIYKS